MMNVKPIPAIALLIIFSLLVWVVFGGTSEDESDEGIIIIDPNFTGIDIDVDWDSEIYLEVTLTEEPNFAETDRIYLYKGNDFDIVIEKNEPEPNEPEDISSWFYIVDINESRKVSLDFIPIWPDYIELDKDLWIDIPIDGFGPIETRCYVYRKGTKIYFKGYE